MRAVAVWDVSGLQHELGSSLAFASDLLSDLSQIPSRLFWASVFPASSQDCQEVQTQNKGKANRVPCQPYLGEI
jgi:hypothetical protein